MFALEASPLKIANDNKCFSFRGYCASDSVRGWNQEMNKRRDFKKLALEDVVKKRCNLLKKWIETIGIFYSIILVFATKKN